MHIVVVGGGVAGLGAALELGKRGHSITVIERDPTPLPDNADDAFEWDRRGAPQVRHSHAFLARLTTILRADHPEVYADLLAAGATEMRFGDDLPPTISDFEPQPGDADLVMLACRRTTFEWVLRRAVLALDTVVIDVGDPVAGLVNEPGSHPPVVTGVRTESGRELAADAVVVANGRRSALPEWMAELGVGPVAETVDDTGIVYFSRFYRLAEGQDYPPRNGPIGGDLGYLKYGVFAGDNRTFSVTLAVSVDDAELRRLLSEEQGFELAASMLTVTSLWVAPGRATPITGVHVMAGLLNRRREFVVDGAPLVLGVHPVGDAHLCTNPLYGRGCSTGFWSSHLLAAAFDEFPADPRRRAIRHDELVDQQIAPHYRSSVTQDAEARRVAAALLAGEDPDDPNDPRSFMRAVFRDGLAPALRTDSVVLRGFFRGLNLLDPPERLITDPDLTARVLAVFSDRDNRPPEPVLGPPRAELMAALAG